MFDPVTIDLISSAPQLDSLELEELPQRFTNAYAEIVAARVRYHGAIDTKEKNEKLEELLEEMRRLAATQELLVTSSPERVDRAAAAFVAGTAHQLCMMAEVIKGGEREAFIDIVRVAPEICSTLLFLIADFQSDAAEMAKHLNQRDDSNSSGSILIKDIGALATGRLGEILDIEPREKDLGNETTGPEVAVDALLRHLHAGLVELAQELLSEPNEVAEIPRSQMIFKEVISLCISRIDGVFDDEGPVAVNIFPGPLHLAKLLLAVSINLADTSLCRIEAPAGINVKQWWRIVRQAANKRPYLWRNHRTALERGYLTKGVSAAISFPTGGGKSTLAELKIAVSLLSGSKAIVLAPTLALVDQTAFTLKNAFKDFSVYGDLDEDIVFTDIVELPEIIVTTPERCLMLQSLQPEAFNDIGLIVFDECHLLHPRDADRSRRSIDAMLCILNLTQLAPEADFLMISAMMQNAAEIAGWISELTGRPCLELDLAWKPTRQARGCVAYSSDRISKLEEILRKAQAKATTKGVPAKVKSQLNAQPSAFFCLRQTWATRKRKDYALMTLLNKSVSFSTGINKYKGNWYLTPNGNKVAGEIAAAAAQDKLKTLIFVQSTIAAESTVKYFRELLPKHGVTLTEDEKVLRKIVEEELGGSQHCYLKIDDNYRVVGGAISHHAQLIKQERLLHESLFKRSDGLSAMFATSTLAQGMNLPSDIVLIAGDSRWDVEGDKMKQLDAHELLNAAGRAGRAGEGGQGFVLVIPSKIINIDEDKSNINSHWMTLQGIFSQSDQCLRIDDPLTGLLDRIHSGALDDNEAYFLARLPKGDGDAPDELAKYMINRSFAAYRMRQEGNNDWIETRISSAILERSRLSPKQELTWLERVAASCGLPYVVIESMTQLVSSGAFLGSTRDCIQDLFEWLEKHPGWLFQLIRPNDIAGLFGTNYRSLSDENKTKLAIPLLKKLLVAWMDGKPLSDLERAIGTAEKDIKTCEIARHFAVRLTADLAFVAGLPARIYTAQAIANGNEPIVPVSILTLSGAVRKGCSSPELLANAIYLNGSSRPAARAEFTKILPYLQSGLASESFEDVRDRVREAHISALLDKF